MVVPAKSARNLLYLQNSRIASSPTKAFIPTLELESCSIFTGVFYSDPSFSQQQSNSVIALEGSISECLPSVEKADAHNSKSCTF